MSGFLLDTHVLLWLLGDPDRVPVQVRDTLADRRNNLWVSAASGLEISTKVRVGKLKPTTLATTLRRRAADIGAIELPISLEHAVVAGELTWVHRDPFDRLLVAQAVVDNLTLVTVARAILTFGGARILSWD